MAALHIRGVDAKTAARLKVLARERGVSVNELILTVVRETAGTVTARPRPRRVHADLDHLFGTWSAADQKAFEKVAREFESVDEELWR